jgi:hypothetical protein
MNDCVTANAQPAYAESFGVASAHSSRRSEAKEERPTLNVQFKTEMIIVIETRAPNHEHRLRIKS